MKKRQKRLSALLLACMMVCMPVSEAYAAISYNAAEGVDGKLLFPGDSMTGITSAVTVDGEEGVLTEGGTWTNEKKKKVYEASMAEDGSVVMTSAGYKIEVVNGTSSYQDPERPTDNHYEYSEEEKLTEEKLSDIACYAEGDIVKITADAPEEGMQFAGWTVDSEEFSLPDSASAETTFEMPKDSFTITATYTEAAPVTYSLTVNNGEGSGTYEAGTPVTVTAWDRSGENLVFAGWSVDTANVEMDTTAASAGFAMAEGDVVLTATYVEAAPVTYSLTVNNGEGSGTYEAGTPVTVTAWDRSGENLVFAGWSVDTANVEMDTTAASAGFAMAEGDVVLTATYVEAAPVTYSLTVNNGEGSGTYEAGTPVTVTAWDRSGENLVFAGWYADSQNISVTDTLAGTTEFVMPEGDVILTATYEEIPVETEPVTEAPTETEPVTEVPTEAPTETEPVTEAPTENIIDIEITETSAEQNPELQSPETQQSETTVQSETTAPQSETTVQTEETISETLQTETTAQTEVTLQTDAPAQLYTVTVENGSGSGDYAAGAVVTIEAAAVAGKEFFQWTTTSTAVQGWDPTQSVTTFTMPAEAVTVTAEYTAATHKVTLENATDGNGATEGVYAENDTVTVTAASAPLGMEFIGFEGTVTVNGQTTALTFADAKAATTTFVMPQGDVTVRAVYTELPKTYVVTVSNGLINSTASQMAVEEGTQINVTANPSPYGQQFSKWTVNGGAYDLGDDTFNSSISVTVTENMSFLAVYEGVQYSVTVEDGYSDYDECVVGTVVTLTADEAPKGMAFDYWYVDSQNVSLGDSYSEVTTFVMPDDNVAVTAMYRRVQYQVTVQNGSADQEYYYYGDTVTITSKYPASGRVFDTWTAESGKADFADASRWKTTFVMPARNVTVAANYTDGPSTADNLILDIVAGGEYYTGDTIKFTGSGAGMSNTNPNPGDYRYRPSGYQIGNVTGTWKSEPYTTSMAINAAGEYTLKVIFNKDVYDGNSWVSDGTSDTKAVTFRVVTKAAGVATGDNTPVILVIAIASVSCILFVVLLVVVLVRRRRR